MRIAKGVYLREGLIEAIQAKAIGPIIRTALNGSFTMQFRATGLSDTLMVQRQSKLAMHSSSGQTNLTSLPITARRTSFSLVSNPKHAVLLLVDKRAGHRNRSIAE